MSDQLAFAEATYFVLLIFPTSCAIVVYVCLFACLLVLHKWTRTSCRSRVGLLPTSLSLMFSFLTLLSLFLFFPFFFSFSFAPDHRFMKCGSHRREEYKVTACLQPFISRASARSNARGVYLKTRGFSMATPRSSLINTRRTLTVDGSSPDHLTCASTIFIKILTIIHSFIPIQYILQSTWEPVCVGLADVWHSLVRCSRSYHIISHLEQTSE